MPAAAQHRDRVIDHNTRAIERIATSARSLPAQQRLLLLLLRGDALSLRCAEHLREMHAPEPDDRDGAALAALNYKLPRIARLTPSGHHAAGDVGRDLILKLEKARRGAFTLTFERGLIAGLPPVLAAALLRLNGGVLGPAAANRIEVHVDESDRPSETALIGWLEDAGLVHVEAAMPTLTPRGRERVQAAWKSCSSGWYGA